MTPAALSLDPVLPPDAGWPAALALALCDGDAPRAHAMLTQWERDLDPDDRPQLEAWRARVLYGLQRPEVAALALERALALGHPDAAALATLALPDGERFGHARLSVGTAGQRADAACDLAWRHLALDRVDEALQLLRTARSLCPGHAEAGRWLRFVQQAGPRAGRLCSFLDAHPPEMPLLADLASLAPLDLLGWCSLERTSRRLLGPRALLLDHPAAWALPAVPGAVAPAATPPSSALARLRSLGVLTRILATDGDYAALPSDHALVGAEVALDLALALEREGRPAHGAATEAWRVAQAVDGQTATDAANALVGLGLRTPECTEVGLLAVRHLRRAQPEQGIWVGYQAALRICAGQVDAGLRQARRALQAPDAEPLSLSLVVLSLRWRGRDGLAEPLLQQALEHARLGSTALSLMREPGGRPFPQVSHRLVPRLPPQ